MQFNTQAGNWRDAAARFTSIVEYAFETSAVPRDDHAEIYSLEAVIVDTLIMAQRDGATAAILHHGDPQLPANMISLREIIRSIMREDCATEYLNTPDCIACDEAFIAALRPLRTPTGN